MKDNSKFNKEIRVIVTIPRKHFFMRIVSGVEGVIFSP